MLLVATLLHNLKCYTPAEIAVLETQNGEASVAFYRDVCHMTLVDKVCISSAGTDWYAASHWHSRVTFVMY
jgi:hypothetical protein